MRIEETSQNVRKQLVIEFFVYYRILCFFLNFDFLSKLGVYQSYIGEFFSKPLGNMAEAIKVKRAQFGGDGWGLIPDGWSNCSDLRRPGPSILVAFWFREMGALSWWNPGWWKIGARRMGPPKSNPFFEGTMLVLGSAMSVIEFFFFHMKVRHLFSLR